MQLPSILLTFTVMAYTLMVSANPVPVGDYIVRSIMPMMYTGPIEPNGPDVTLFGDVQVSKLLIKFYIPKTPSALI